LTVVVGGGIGVVGVGVGRVLSFQQRLDLLQALLQGLDVATLRTTLPPNLIISANMS
jgi:hypothetical protein